VNLTLLGTGAADGWPNPHCRCASCTAARAAGTLRGQTSALLDETLLLDCGPETPQSAQRAGLDLTRLRHVLLTHAHPDHCGPAFLLFRAWVFPDKGASAEELRDETMRLSPVRPYDNDSRENRR